MLNIKPLGGEAVPFYIIIYFSIAKKNNSEWEIREHKKRELVLFSSPTCHGS
jgi:hypothetical protein